MKKFALSVVIFCVFAASVFAQVQGKIGVGYLGYSETYEQGSSGTELDVDWKAVPVNLGLFVGWRLGLYVDLLVDFDPEVELSTQSMSRSLFNPEIQNISIGVAYLHPLGSRFRLTAGAGWFFMGGLADINENADALDNAGVNGVVGMLGAQLTLVGPLFLYGEARGGLVLGDDGESMQLNFVEGSYWNAVVGAGVSFG